MQIKIPETNLTRELHLVGGLGRHKETGERSVAVVLSAMQSAPAGYCWRMFYFDWRKGFKVFGASR